MERRQEGDAVHLGHKNRWQSAGCKGELPAKCTASPRRQLPVALLSGGGGWLAWKGLRGKAQRKLLFSLCADSQVSHGVFLPLRNFNFFSLKWNEFPTFPTSTPTRGFCDSAFFLPPPQDGMRRVGAAWELYPLVSGSRLDLFWNVIIMGSQRWLAGFIVTGWKINKAPEAVLSVSFVERRFVIFIQRVKGLKDSTDFQRGPEF